jgi:hypothetical protein
MKHEALRQQAMNREAQRQMALVRALWRDDAAVPTGLRALPRADVARGLDAYRANAGALAERALAAAYPTVAALVGDEAFSSLARHFWQVHAPQRGDVGTWGEALPAFIADSESLAPEPYLADVARLDWAVHAATRAADASAYPPDLGVLAQSDPAALRLQLAPGAAVLTSRFPVATIWQAHHADATFADVRTAFDESRGDRAFVWRDPGFVVRVQPLDTDEAAFNAALLGGCSLAAALDAAGGSFAFDRWLVRALGSHWLVAFTPDPDTTPP